MPPSLEALNRPLADGPVRLDLFGAEHVEPLRAACEEDQAIWEIYPVNMRGADFDRQITQFHQDSNRVRYSVMQLDEQGAARLVGVTNYISIDCANAVVEIGGTYLAPGARGGAVNGVMKRLMIDHGFACGFRRIELRVDDRNTRSKAAVLKLGAVHEGTLRKNRVTWTGHIRDTAVFSLLVEDWAAAQAAPA